MRQQKSSPSSACLCALFHQAPVHMFSDRGSGPKLEGDNGSRGAAEA